MGRLTHTSGMLASTNVEGYTIQASRAGTLKASLNRAGSARLIRIHWGHRRPGSVVLSAVYTHPFRQTPASAKEVLTFSRVDCSTPSFYNRLTSCLEPGDGRQPSPAVPL